VRIGKLDPSAVGGCSSGQREHWIRTLGLTLVLLASVIALALIVEGQYGGFWPGTSGGPASSAEAFSSTRAGAKAGAPAVAITEEEEGRYRVLAEYLARRYRVSQDVTFDFVSRAHEVGRQLGLDPLLIIAVISVESRFNPIAESVAGAKGLMQIIPKYHGDKLEEFGGEHAVFDPATNIQIGAQILKEYIRHTGNLGIALQMYAGALGDSEDQYTRKVLYEKERLQRVLSRYSGRPPTPAAVKTAAVSDTRLVGPAYD
jgi:soluble lytic murein transglycosylase-like protein